MYKPTMKMKIVFDEEKVQREGKYDINSMYELVDNYFKQCNLRKVSKGEYIDTGNKKDFVNMLNSLVFEDVDWFISNAIVWDFSEFDDEGIEWNKESFLEPSMYDCA